ncbi:MAG: lema protein LemA protein [Parcubacteria group bacterium]|nr:lema protein LemA protein [Parcubacteria group bacterium]
MKKGLLIALGIIVLLGIWVYSSYNTVVTKSTAADVQWAQVETVYQRRFDLIPNLVNTVKGFYSQENKIYSEIAQARTQYAGAATPDAKAAAASNLESSLGRLLVITENYPTLASSAVVRDFSTSLEGSENRISVERNRFNEIIGDYNATIARFPANLIAGMFGFHTRSYFKSDAAAATAPAVNFE